MSFDFRRSAALTPGLALAVSVCLLADTALLLLLYLAHTGFTTDAAYRLGVREFDIRSSVSDVLLLSLVKACVLSAFWSLAWGKPLALTTTVAAIIYSIAKLALYDDEWAPSTLLQLAVLLIPLPTSVIEAVAVGRTRYTSEDPDWALAEAVEAEAKEMSAVGRGGVGDGVGDGDPDATSHYAPLLDAAEAGAREGPSQSSKPPSTLYLLFRYAAPDHGLLAAGLGFILLSSLFRLALPNFAARLLTLVVSEEGAALGTPSFTEAAVYFTAAASGLVFFTGLRIWATAKAEVRVVARLQRIVFMAILRQDIATFDAQGTGALTSRLTSDCTLLGSILTTNCNVAIQSAINLIGSTAYLFVLDARLAGAYLALVLLFFFITRVFGARAKRLQKEIQSLKAEANQAADQAISLVRLVRAFAAEEVEKRRYDAKTLTTVATELSIKMLYAIYVPIVVFLENSLVLTVVLLGAYLVAHGHMEAADLTAFYFYSTTITAAMQSLADNVLSLLTGLGAGSKLMEIIAQQPTIPIKGGRIPARPPTASGAAVEFEDVSLAYDALPAAAGQEGTAAAAAAAAVVDEAKVMTVVIDRLSLRIRPGERVAIVGLSGSGKSSLVSLLLRLYAPSTGRIRLDGADISELDARYLRAQLGVVTQDAPLLGGISVRDNIVYALPGGEHFVDNAAVEAAARAAAIHDRIVALPAGYATVVGERGVTLSGGERQRLAVARAVLRAPRLLVLDEATSALDTQREREVQEALAALHKSRGMTMIIIAHRLSTVVDADRIIVLSAGKIREEGTHSELLALGGLYKSLVERQLREEAVRRQHEVAAVAEEGSGSGEN